MTKFNAFLVNNAVFIDKNIENQSLPIATFSRKPGKTLILEPVMLK